MKAIRIRINNSARVALLVETTERVHIMIPMDSSGLRMVTIPASTPYTDLDRTSESAIAQFADAAKAFGCGATVAKHLGLSEAIRKAGAVIDDDPIDAFVSLLDPCDELNNEAIETEREYVNEPATITICNAFDNERELSPAEALIVAEEVYRSLPAPPPRQEDTNMASSTPKKKAATKKAASTSSKIVPRPAAKKAAAKKKAAPKPAAPMKPKQKAAAKKAAAKVPDSAVIDKSKRTTTEIAPLPGATPREVFVAEWNFNPSASAVEKVREMNQHWQLPALAAQKRFERLAAELKAVHGARLKP